MSHLDLLAKLLRASEPAQAGALGASDVPRVVGAVEPSAGHQATQAICPHVWLAAGYQLVGSNLLPVMWRCERCGDFGERVR